MRAGEALGLDIKSIHPDFRTLDIVQKAKRGELQDYMKTKNADTKHGRVVDLPAKLAAVLRDFVGTRRSGLVFCEEDGSQISQRDILKYSLHPILKNLELEQGGLNIFRRFRITTMETAEVPQALQHTWSGHARTHVSEFRSAIKSCCGSVSGAWNGPRRLEWGSISRPNQLDYVDYLFSFRKWVNFFRIWWTRGDSNPRPPRCERGITKAKTRRHNQLAF